MKKLLTAVLTVGLCWFFSTPAQAQWTENFDSYATGNINGNGPWVDWGGTLTPDVSNAQSSSAPNSLALTANPLGVDNAYGSDVYATSIDPGGLVTSGQWSFSYELFIESGMTGSAEMYISEFLMDGTGAGFARGLWLTTEGGVMGVRERTAAANPALVYDAWTPVELAIDLNADTVVAKYNNTVVFSGVWDDQLTGTPSIGGLNFWADGAAGQSGTYYVDDLNLAMIPEPNVGLLLGLGALVVVLLRRKS